MPHVTMYVTQVCPYCVAAKRFLKEVKRVPDGNMKFIDVSGDPVARQELTERSGQRTVPQIWIGKTHVGGYDDLRALDAKGGLDPLLAGQG